MAWVPSSWEEIERDKWTGTDFWGFTEIKSCTQIEKGWEGM